MKKFFYPKSIAVAGASPNEDRISNVIVANLLEMGYEGEVFPVGKRGGQILGLPIYLSLEEIPKTVDLLVIMVPASAVPALLKDAGKIGIDRAVIITDGFNESGEDGVRLAREIKAIAGKCSIRFIGPNCQGVICSSSGVCVPFAHLFRHQVKKGGVSIVSQSGSIGWMGTSELSYEIDGISKIASIGNKLDVDELELLEYLIEDQETKIIVLYLESFSDGRGLFELARNSHKPIIVFKSNISGKDSKIAFSHTAALASDDRITNAALAQAGILRAYNFRDMIQMCKALYLPLVKGPNLAIMASSGGLALIGEDTVQRENLRLAELPEYLLQEIANMGKWKRRSTTNPIDLGGFFDNLDIISVVDRVLSLQEVDGAVLSTFNTGPYHAPLTGSEFVDNIERISRTQSKPIAMHLVSDQAPLAEIKSSKNFPVFDTLEDAVGALSTQWKYRKILRRIRSPYRVLEKEKKKALEILAKTANRSQYPSDLTAMELAGAYGIRCEMPIMAVNLEEARLKAAEIGYPLVMKLTSPDISHKTDVGGVKVNIKDDMELGSAFIEIMREAKTRVAGAQIDGVMLQKMIFGGIELIMGGKVDRDFGPVIMFGMGGVLTETLRDVSFRLAPIHREESYEMIEETEGFSLLKGVRGEKAYDIPSLAESLERLSILMSDFPEIVELDLNPIKLFENGQGLIAVDGRVRVG
jgi:acyl-CoA synthetase (NDP forming)